MTESGSSRAPEHAQRTDARAFFQRFIGVALGGGRGKNTAIARLELRLESGSDSTLTVAEAKLRYGHRGTGSGAEEPEGDAYFRDEVLVEYLRRWTDETTVVAMDAPLTLPACIRCQLPCPGVEACQVPVVEWMRDHAPRLASRGRSDSNKPVVTPYTQRATELLLAHLGLKPREALGQGTGPLAARAHHLRRILSPQLRLQENLIEVHPRATLIRLFGRKLTRRAHQGDDEQVWDARKRILSGLADTVEFDYVWPELVVRNVHVFSAVIGAFTAYRWAQERWRGPADLEALPEHGADETAPGAVQQACEALGSLWLEDGWISVPPKPRKRR